MKEKKKPHGTKAEIRAYKKRARLIGTAVIVIILVVIIAFSSFLIYSYLNPSSNEPPTPPLELELKAAIVDHLSLTAPNQTFIDTATNILEPANYTVDYYPGEEVNIEFYRNLATHGYSLIVLRVHSTATKAGGIESSGCLFTSEVYSTTEYVLEQLNNQIVMVSFKPYEPPFYFAIKPEFIISSMNGRFQNTTIIQMGCDGLANTPMAEAFIKKGAKVYIGWTGDVLASRTDKATAQLLEHLVTEKQTIRQAVENTKNEVGPDPISESILDYYPTEAQNHVILNTHVMVETALVLRCWPSELLGFVNLTQPNVWPASVGMIAYVRVVVEEEAGV